MDVGFLHVVSYFSRLLLAEAFSCPTRCQILGSPFPVLPHVERTVGSIRTQGAEPGAFTRMLARAALDCVTRRVPVWVGLLPKPVQVMTLREVLYFGGDPGDGGRGEGMLVGEQKENKRLIPILVSYPSGPRALSPWGTRPSRAGCFHACLPCWPAELAVGPDGYIMNTLWFKRNTLVVGERRHGWCCSVYPLSASVGRWGQASLPRSGSSVPRRHHFQHQASFTISSTSSNKETADFQPTPSSALRVNKCKWHL